MHIQQTLVLHLGVVEEISLHPSGSRRFPCFSAEFVNDAGNRHELDDIRIADENLIQQHVTRGMIVAINESRNDRHLLGVESLRSLADERLDIFGASNCYEPVTLD